MALILKTTYDETLQAYAPGRLLLHEVIRRAFVLWPGRSLEFYTNANADQLLRMFSMAKDSFYFPVIDDTGKMTGVVSLQDVSGGPR